MAMHMPDHAGTEPQQKRAPKGALFAIRTGAIGTALIGGITAFVIFL